MEECGCNEKCVICEFCEECVKMCECNCACSLEECIECEKCGEDVCVSVCDCNVCECTVGKECDLCKRREFNDKLLYSYPIFESYRKQDHPTEIERAGSLEAVRGFDDNGVEFVILKDGLVKLRIKDYGRLKGLEVVVKKEEIEKIILGYQLDNEKKKLDKMNEADVFKKASEIVIFQMHMIRRFPQVMNSLKNENNYEIEIKKYNRMLLEASDSLLELEMSIRKKEKEKTINEILNIAEFLVKLSKDKQLVNELGVNEMIKYFKENEYI